MRKVGIVRDKRYLEHNMGAYHPESPKRLEVIYEMLEDADIKDKFIEISPREASQQEICYIHSPEYLSMIAQTEGKPHVTLDPDTSTCENSYRVALLAAGGLCEAIASVVTGKTENAFALIRPPGHHAERDRGQGFCIFNNVAIGARYAQKVYSLKKVLIADWDLHHGRTEDIFYEDDSVFYFSTYEKNNYPYFTGSEEKIGKGIGEGYNLNRAYKDYCDDETLLKLYDDLPKWFDFDIVLVSAGYDLMKDEPISTAQITFDGLRKLIRKILNFSKDKPIAFLLEGGYNLQSLVQSVKITVNELITYKIDQCFD